MKRVAAIDCGTNSIRLLVGDLTQCEADSIDPSFSSRPSRARITDLTREMRIVRLGQGVDRTGELSPRAVDRTLDATEEFARIIHDFHVAQVRFVATSATRDARNRDVFVQGVERILGQKPEVISGQEEASLSFRGAVSALEASESEPILVVDIGGGSTELVLGTFAAGVDQSVSIDMGSVRVTEQFFLEDSALSGISVESRNAATQWIDSQLDEAECHIDLTRVQTLLGVAGTVTTVSAHALGCDSYQPDRVHGSHLSVGEVIKACNYMIDEPVAVKAELGFMPSGREDVIAAGALIWNRVIARVEQRMRQSGCKLDYIVTSEHDILDGIALSMA